MAFAATDTRSRGAERLMSLPKIEMTDGKFFNYDADRLHVLSLLLESVGIDAAVKLGSPELWRQAIAGLPNGESV
jgi:hypothetical protein